MDNFRNRNSFVGNSNSFSELPTTGWKRTLVHSALLGTVIAANKTNLLVQII